MGIYITLKMAIKDILGNKLRTFLTMLGIIIGVSSVIILVSIAQGSSTAVKESIQSMGSNLLTVNIRGSYNKQNKLNYDDMKALEALDSILYSSPVITGSVTTKYETTSYDTSLTGVDSSYMDTQNSGVEKGRFIVDLDLANRNKIAILGSDVVEELFGNADPLGKDILLNGTHFQVVGILKSKGSSMMGSSDDVVIIPITTAQRFLGQSSISTIYIQAKNEESVSLAESQLEQEIMKVFNDEDAFRIFNQTSLLDTMSSVTASMSIMMGGIAAISLLVGGIGIMNIMLVSVTERTKEIGIRKSIGAKRSSILKQFLIESAVVSGTGGIIGVIIAIIANYTLPKFGVTTSMPFSIILIAFGFSLVIGVFFGMYPANKAAKLKPVDALRYE